jgi:transposase
LDDVKPYSLSTGWAALSPRPDRCGVGGNLPPHPAVPFLKKLYADGGYRGPVFQEAMRSIVSQVNVEIVKRPDHAKGFVELPKRWVVERTLAWLNRCRRLAKHWECQTRKAPAFLILAAIRLMVRPLGRV